MRNALLIAILVASCAVATIAGSVYDRATVTRAETDTVSYWTNTADYAAVKLVRLWTLYAYGVSNNVAVARITSDGLYTQAVGTITGPLGNTATFTAGYLEPGDVLRFTSSPGTGGVEQVEYEVQQH